MEIVQMFNILVVEDEANVRKLVMTASVMDAQVDLDQYPTVMEVLVKPFSVVKLLAAIERALHITLPHQT
jgi:CheY-like chemotaxis protein